MPTSTRILLSVLLPVVLQVILASAVFGQNHPGIKSEATSEVVRKGLGSQADMFIQAEADSGYAGSVLIAFNDEIVLHKAYGSLDEAQLLPAEISTKFWVASVSKQFAASALLKLDDQNRVDVQDPISEVFPHVPKDKQGITFHQLLTHTAGFEQRYAADGISDRKEAIDAILEAPLVRSPGEGFGYSNDAYNLIAAAVEIIAEEPFEKYIREELLEPAGMDNTGFWGPINHPEVADIRFGTFADSTMLEPNWGFRGGVGMFSTSADLYAWTQRLTGTSILSRSGLDAMLSAHFDRGDIGIGYGWFTSASPDGTPSIWTRGYEGFGHGAAVSLFPEKRLTIIVLSNAGEHAVGRPMSHEVTSRLTEFLFRLLDQ